MFEIHFELCSVYRRRVYKYLDSILMEEVGFEEGKTARDVPRTDRLNESTSSMQNVQQVQDLLEEDRRMTISEICSQLQSPACKIVIVHQLKKNLVDRSFTSDAKVQQAVI